MHTDQIVRLARVFAAHTGLKVSTISTYAASDGKWLKGLDEGNGCTLRKAAAVVGWFSEHWPDADLEWPSDIQRPTKTGRAA